MSILRSPNLLRYTLVADAVASAASAALMIAGAAFLAPLLGLPRDLLFEAGLSLIPFVALVLYVATRQRPAEGAVWVVIALNLIWVAASVLLLMSNVVAPTMLGYAFVAAQAFAVLMLADLEYFGLRNASAAGLTA